jgi:hypothetical protein
MAFNDEYLLYECTNNQVGRLIGKKNKDNKYILGNPKN